MLKNVCLQNFIVFKERQNIEFGGKSPYIFVGENGSGKSAVFEGIRRCLTIDKNTSVSNPSDKTKPSYFVCWFILGKENIISGVVGFPPEENAEDLQEYYKFVSDRSYFYADLRKSDELYEQIENNETDIKSCLLKLFELVKGSNKNGNIDKVSNDKGLVANESGDEHSDVMQSSYAVSEHEQCSVKDSTIENISDTHLSGTGSTVEDSSEGHSSDIDSLDYDSGDKSKGTVRTVKDTCERDGSDEGVSVQDKDERQSCDENQTLKNDTVESILWRLLKTSRAKSQVEGRTKCQQILNNLSKHIVFTFPLRTIGPLQWSESEKIRANKRQDNYEEAEKRCEIIRAFLEDKEANKNTFDYEYERRIFETITKRKEEPNYSGYNFELRDGKIVVDGNNFKLLKTPEGILEAKHVSILLSGKYKTILLEEPDRGMHPQFIQRMSRVIRQDVEENERVVILTTHNPIFLTQWTLSQCYRFCRDEIATIKCIGEAIANVGKKKKTSMDIETDDLNQLRKMTTCDAQTIFFATKVLFCEGDSDLLFLSEIVNLLLSNKPYENNDFLSDSKIQLQSELYDLTILKMGSCSATENWQNICKELCIPARFLLDTDLQSTVEEHADIFQWPDGTIEDMVKAFVGKITEDGNHEELKKMIEEMGFGGKKKVKLFIKPVQLPLEKVTRFMAEMIKHVSSTDSLGKFLSFLYTRP